MNREQGHDTYTMGWSEKTTASHASRTIQSDAAFLIPHIKSDSRILDIGCGPGTITVGFAKLAPAGTVIGVDIGDEVVNRASRMAVSNGLEQKVRFEQGNVLEGLRFDDDTFDVVFLSQVFGHLRAPHQQITAMKEIRRVLKPGGILASRDASSIQFYPYSDELQQLWVGNILKATQPKWPGPFMRSWLRQAGFDVDNVAKTNIDGGSTTYANRVSCEWWAKTLAARLSKGDPFRESWLKAGISDDDADACADMLLKWGNHEDAWYCATQSEVIARK